MAKNITYKDAVKDFMPELPLWEHENIRRYSLYQGVLLTLAYLKQISKKTVIDSELYERIEFIANPSLGFPTCDIDHIEFFEEHNEVKAKICVNPLGLIGANSPLPAFYSEQALADGGSNTTQDFLNFFNDRLQRLLLSVWKKYRYHAFYQQGALDVFSAKLFALIGLGHPNLRASDDLNWKRLLPYLGLLSLRAHSATLVEAVLRYYFKHQTIHVEQCVKRQVAIPQDQQNQMGLGNSMLGDSLVIGTEITDRSGKFRIHVLMLSWQRFHQLLPINKEYRQLCTLVRFILKDPLDYDIKLQLIKEEIKDFTLGEKSNCLLGWTSWLGKEQADGEILLTSQI